MVKLVSAQAGAAMKADRAKAVSIVLISDLLP
jgi:hypothetical protein